MSTLHSFSCVVVGFNIFYSFLTSRTPINSSKKDVNFILPTWCPNYLVLAYSCRYLKKAIQKTWQRKVFLARTRFKGLRLSATKFSSALRLRFLMETSSICFAMKSRTMGICSSVTSGKGCRWKGLASWNLIWVREKLRSSYWADAWPWRHLWESTWSRF